MKTVITIQDGIVTVAVNDHEPVVVKKKSEASEPQAPDPIKFVKAPVKFLPVPPIEEAPDERKCEICAGSMYGRNKLSKVCSDKCQLEKNRLYKAAWAAKQRDKPQPVRSEPSVPKVKPQQQLRVFQGEVVPKPLKDFKDPWSCARCQQYMNLCKLHKDLQDNGATPPRIFPT